MCKQADKTEDVGWMILPSEILMLIFSYLKPTELFNCVLVCTFWRDLLMNFDKPKKIKKSRGKKSRGKKWFADGLKYNVVNNILMNLKKGRLNKSKTICHKKEDFEADLFGEPLGRECECQLYTKYFFIDVHNFFPNCENLVKCMVKRMIRNMLLVKGKVVAVYGYEGHGYETVTQRFSSLCEMKALQTFCKEQNSYYLFDLIQFCNCEYDETPNYYADNIYQAHKIPPCTANCYVVFTRSDSPPLKRSIMKQIENSIVFPKHSDLSQYLWDLPSPMTPDPDSAHDNPEFSELKEYLSCLASPTPPDPDSDLELFIS